MTAVREGEVLGGKYRVERVLGQGGMGVVVAAEHLQLGQRVALKFLLPEACENPQAVARFLREARAAVQIQSEHVARVTDVGQLESGAPYMVMEFLRGSDLNQIVQQRGALPVADAVDYVLQACEAIAEAHSLGIVHRDLKPPNLFLTRRPDGSELVKVLDFGISKATRADLVPVNLTNTSATMGSPVYMSPEQVRNVKDVDARADLWSLGVILHELLARETPFYADTAPALFAMITADPPVSLRQHRADAPAELEAVVLKCLEKDRARRYQTVAELARALRPFASRDGAASVDRVSRILGARTSAHPTHPAPAGDGGPPVPVSGTAAATLGEWGTTSSGRKRSRVGLIAVGATLAVGAVGAYFALRGDTPSATETASATTAEKAPPAPAAPAPTAASTPVVTAELAAPATSVTVAPTDPSAAPSNAPPRSRSQRSVPRAVATAKPKGAAAPTSKSAKDLFDDTQ
jgi:serine/threonine-protein kinase